MRTVLSALIIGLVLLSAPAFAQDQRDVQVHFQHGSSGTVIRETITSWSTPVTKSFTFRMRSLQEDNCRY